MIDMGNLPPAFWLAPSQGAVYVVQDATIRLTVYNSAAGVRLALEGRLLDIDGNVDVINQEFAPTTDRVASREFASIREGWVLAGHVRAIAGAPRVGQCYVRVELVRGRTGGIQPVSVLAQGYVTETSWLAWPGSELRDSTDGRGCIRSITGTDPAAGVEISETVPTNARWRLISFRALLATDGTVTNRSPFLMIDDGATICAAGPAASSQVASQSLNHTWATYGAAGATGSPLYGGFLPLDLVLPAGFRIRTQTTSLQAGDNWGAPQLLVEEWIED